MIVFGQQMYGKVDQVPGLFYVGTKFLHLQFVPLIPTGSFLMLDDGGENGVSIGLNGKSVLFGYARAACILGFLGTAGSAVISLIETAKGKPDWPEFATLAGIAILLLFLFFISYRFSRAGALRALTLAGKAGIEPEVVAPFFVNSPELDRLEALRSEQANSTFETEP